MVRTVDGTAGDGKGETGNGTAGKGKRGFSHGLRFRKRGDGKRSRGDAQVAGGAST